MRARLVDNVRTLLQHAGFAVTDVFRHRPISFDFLARRDDQLYIIKVLTNIDSLSEDVGREMLVLARFLSGRPLLVGLKASSGSLEAGAVYVRHGVPILSFEGLREYVLAGAPPVAFAAPGGFCVRLDGDMLQALRSERGLSLGQLADVAGVSRRAISMYEAGMSATVEAALRLEEFLEEPLIVPIDPFARMDDPEDPTEPAGVEGIEDPFARNVFRSLAAMGFGIVPTARSPFNGIGIVDPGRPVGEGNEARRASDALLVAAAREAGIIRKRTALLRSVSMVTERTSVFIVSETTDGDTGTPVLAKKDLKTVDDAAALLDLVRERREA